MAKKEKNGDWVAQDTGCKLMEKSGEDRHTVKSIANEMRHRK